MAGSNDHDIHVLNGLIEATLDSLERRTPGRRDDPDAADLPVDPEGDERRHRIVSDLQDAVRALGGEPKDTASILAKTQRALSGVKQALIPGDREEPAVVPDDDAALRARFDKALEDTRLAATTRETIRRAVVPLAATNAPTGG